METTYDDGITVTTADPEPTGAPAPAEPAAPPPEEEGTPDSAPAPEEDGDEPPVPRGLQRRIDTLTRRNAEYQREIDMLKGAVQTLGQRPQDPPRPPAPAAPEGPPRAEDFATHEDFLTALVDHRTEARLRQREEAQAAAQADVSQRQAFEASQAAIRTREAEVVQAHPDYYDRCQELGPQLAPHVMWALRQAGAHAPDILLGLHAHRDQIPRLNQTPPHQVAFELALLRAPASPNGTPPAPPASGREPPPPAPPRAVNTGGRAAPNASYRPDMTQTQFEDWYFKTYGRR